MERSPSIRKCFAIDVPEGEKHHCLFCCNTSQDLFFHIFLRLFAIEQIFEEIRKTPTIQHVCLFLPYHHLVVADDARVEFGWRRLHLRFHMPLFHVTDTECSWSLQIVQMPQMYRPRTFCVCRSSVWVTSHLVEDEELVSAANRFQILPFEQLTLIHRECLLVGVVFFTLL